jgi:Holliday junction DNA helicase, RuvB subunit
MEFIESALKQDIPQQEVPLRPQSLDDFMGQPSIRERLEVMICASRKRQEPLQHCLFSGPPGLGKTTLATILAKAMGSNLVVTSGPVLEKAGDLAGILTNLKQGDIFFIDEIHRMPRAVEEYLYRAMEDFVLDLMIDSGPQARSVQLKLEKFTLVGATTRSGMLSEPLRTRFPFLCRLDYYEPAVLQKITMRTSALMDFKIPVEAAFEIAERSRGTPRIVNHLVRWVRDYSISKENSSVSLSLVQEALDMLGIDRLGLDEMDKKILLLIRDVYNGGPVGLNTLAAAVGEEPHTIEEVYEPYLILRGFLQRTPRGRIVTPLAYSHIK